MEFKKKNIDVYIVEGKEFINKEEAVKYEEQINNELRYTYFTITHSPDLTEGRGYYKTSTIAVPKNYAEKATALKYCFETFGTPLEFVQGCSPIANWILSESKSFKTLKELCEFKNSKVSEGIGDYRKSVNRQITYLNAKGNVIDGEVEKEI
jgi:hypothetical protein